MGLKDKLMFWKKSDDFDFDMPKDPLGINKTNPGVPVQDNLNLPSDTNDPFAPDIAMPGAAPSPPAPTSFSAKRDNEKSTATHRDAELMNSKLDTIKAILQSLDQRVGAIEQIARADQARQQQKNNPKNRLW
ncbi:hypothetical protein HOA92_03885 [archaeon]|jgi:hypothetical protein|nr:hypothetical protein [archaeon]MBT6762153.1 hypothetical protein [archaeon]